MQKIKHTSSQILRWFLVLSVILSVMPQITLYASPQGNIIPVPGTSPPAQVWQSDSGVKMVSVGNNHSLAIRNDGTLWAWGENDNGRLGINPMPSNNVYTPMQVGTANNWIYVAAGKEHSIALNANGQLFAFGAGEAGRLGTGNDNNVNTITALSNFYGNHNIKIVSVSVQHGVAIDTNGSLWTWGSNAQGALGNYSGLYSSVPIAVSAKPGNTWIDAAAGGLFYSNDNRGSFSLGIQSDGSLWAWGWNRYGQLGTNGYGNEYSPQNITPIVNGIAVKFKNVFAGPNNSFAIDASGNVWAWGGNENGQLGYNNSPDDSVFTPRVGNILVPTKLPFYTNIKTVSAAQYHTAILTHDGILTVVGATNGRWFGDSGSSRISRINNSQDDFKVLGVETGGWNTSFIKHDGSVMSVGCNDAGQTGSGSRVNTLNTPMVSMPSLALTMQPTGKIFKYGTISGTLEVDAISTLIGGAAHTYQWYQNNVNSSSGGTALTSEGSNTKSLQIPTNLLPGTYYFYVVVQAPASTPSVASVISEVVSVRVETNMFITKQPANLTVTQNAITAQDVLTATAYEADGRMLNFQWFFSMQPDGSNAAAITYTGAFETVRNADGSFTSTLKLNPQLVQGNYYYFAKITDTQGVAEIKQTNVARVTVTPPKNAAITRFGAMDLTGAYTSRYLFFPAGTTDSVAIASNGVPTYLTLGVAAYTHLISPDVYINAYAQGWAWYKGSFARSFAQKNPQLELPADATGFFVINGLNLSADDVADFAVLLPPNATIVVQGTNTIQNVHNVITPSANNVVSGIATFLNSSLIIRGTGQLDVIGPPLNVASANMMTAGMSVGDLTIIDNTAPSLVISSSGGAVYNAGTSSGMNINGIFTQNAAKVSAKGGSLHANNAAVSAGISSQTNVAQFYLSGGAALNAAGVVNPSAGFSYGIKLPSINFSGITHGAVTAQGASQALSIQPNYMPGSYSGTYSSVYTGDNISAFTSMGSMPNLTNERYVHIEAPLLIFDASITHQVPVRTYGQAAADVSFAFNVQSVSADDLEIIWTVSAPNVVSNIRFTAMPGYPNLVVLKMMVDPGTNVGVYPFDIVIKAVATTGSPGYKVVSGNLIVEKAIVQPMVYPNIFTMNAQEAFIKNGAKAFTNTTEILALIRVQLPDTVPIQVGVHPVQYHSVVWSIAPSASINQQQGAYVITGTVSSDANTNIQPVTVGLYITPVTAMLPTLTDIEVQENNPDSAADAQPKKGTIYNALEGASITQAYMIDWGVDLVSVVTGALNPPLYTNNPKDFTGVLSWVNPPVWLTLPADNHITRNITMVAAGSNSVTVIDGYIKTARNLSTGFFKTDSTVHVVAYAPPIHYEFSHWEVLAPSQLTLPETTHATFTMPDEAVVIKAVFVQSVPVAISITPSYVVLHPSDAYTFFATVIGVGPVQDVVWTIEGNTSADTFIDINGRVVLGADESASAIAVKAVSVVDASVIGIAVITVSNVSSEHGQLTPPKFPDIPGLGTIIFDAQGGFVTPAAVYVRIGDVVHPPADVENGDLVFGGWYEDSDLVYVAMFPWLVQGHMTFYAAWLPAGSAPCVHNWDAGMLITSPTCHQEGLMMHECLNHCGKRWREILPMTLHHPGMWVYTIYPGATTQGEMVQHCIICNDILNWQIIPATGPNTEILDIYDDDSEDTTDVPVPSTSSRQPTLAPQPTPAPITLHVRAGADDGTVAHELTVTGAIDENNVLTVDMDLDTIVLLIEKALAAVTDSATSPVVCFDFSDLPVQSASFAIPLFEKLAKARVGIEIQFPDGIIYIDPDAVDSIYKDASGDTDRVLVKLHQSTEALNNAQHSAVQDTDLVYEITIYVGSQRITNFNGRITIRIPFTQDAPAGVWHLDESGYVHFVTSALNADNEVVFSTNHLSHYMINQLQARMNMVLLTVGSYTLLSNGVAQFMDVVPIIVNDRVMVPLKFVADVFDAHYSWNESTAQVTLHTEYIDHTFTIGVPVPGMMVAPLIQNDRTYVPLRYVGEAFGAVVTWIEETQQVKILQWILQS